MRPSSSLSRQRLPGAVAADAAARWQKRFSLASEGDVMVQMVSSLGESHIPSAPFVYELNAVGPV
jgi:hypothetical protein